MRIYIVLMRGINLGNHHKVKMADLRSFLESERFQNVSTYIHSGNIVFTHEGESLEVVSACVRRVLDRHYDFEIPFQLFDLSSWCEMVAFNPFPLHSEELVKRSHVTLLSSIPDMKSVSQLSEIDSKGDQIRWVQRAIYLQCEGAYHQTKFGNNRIEKVLEREATTRTWRTIVKISDLVDRLVVALS
ncbi:DUF1697 domain-containing protein [Halosquirtibacter laminarini]|uniref:DUF1697 domain-containing protein n=1 Tax=Halosquirtibacter laminarini TaxID=3374600 RepID=A0AC61NKN4_9BACT|nr:DUF1697 domain-containing protein [Prolixibacteraceae bacterium]